MKRGKHIFTAYTLVATIFLLIVYCGNRAVTVMAENVPIERKICIIIDPGHGGVDGGAVSCTGKAESTYNLDISLRLRDLLRFLGHKVSMTREQDISVHTKGDNIAQKKASDLKERVRMVNSREEALLLSIHQNTFSDSQYSGLQVFYADTAGSKELAELLQKTVQSEISPRNNRTCKKSTGIYLMEHIQCTGVLIECGFLSNPAEESKLGNGDYQKKLCCAISGAVNQHLSNT